MSTKEMREPTFLILTALADGRKHGYALIAEAAKLSGNRVQLKVGTLYAALDRLAEQGLVAIAGEEVADGRLRRYYELTEGGATALAEAASRSAHIAAEAKARLQKHRPGLAGAAWGSVA